MKCLKIIYFILILLSVKVGYSQTNSIDQHINVSMRMIGHQILLASGDSISRILSVQKELNRYEISFESEFEFVPDDLIFTIGDVVEETKIATSYLVEVEKCLTKEIVYSYEVGCADSLNLMPCKKRVQSRGCYNVYLTIIESNPNKSENQESTVNYLVIILILVLLVVGILIVNRKKKTQQKSTKTESNLISIGDYKFDQIQMELFYAKDKVELTSKESDLLILLHSSANKVVERDSILQSVWGDEGDYVGRTLDVFISKLRKKLTKDDSVKIVNVRGVGYKLIIGDLN